MCTIWQCFTSIHIWPYSFEGETFWMFFLHFLFSCTSQFVYQQQQQQQKGTRGPKVTMVPSKMWSRQWRLLSKVDFKAFFPSASFAHKRCLPFLCPSIQLAPFNIQMIGLWLNNWQGWFGPVNFVDAKVTLTTFFCRRLLCQVFFHWWGWRRWGWCTSLLMSWIALFLFLALSSLAFFSLSLCVQLGQGQVECKQATQWPMWLLLANDFGNEWLFEWWRVWVTDVQPSKDQRKRMPNLATGRIELPKLMWMTSWSALIDHPPKKDEGPQVNVHRLKWK